MSIDVFGRRLGKHSLSNEGYKKTEDGHYDIENKRLCNVAPPRQKSDAVNLKTLDEYLFVRVHGELDHKLREIENRIENVATELSEMISKLEFEIKTLKTKTIKEIVVEAIKRENAIILTALKNKIESLRRDSATVKANMETSVDLVSKLKIDVANLDTRLTGAIKAMNDSKVSKTEKGH